MNSTSTSSANASTSTDAASASTSAITANQPSEKLLNDIKGYVKTCIPLYEAAVTGNWKDAYAIFKEHPGLVKFAITENNDTALHVAASAKETKKSILFVNNLMKLMETHGLLESLELKNKKSNTAFCLASAAGNINMVKIMAEKNHDLLEIPGNKGMMPLSMSASMGKHKIVKYLYKESKKMSSNEWLLENNRQLVLQKCVECDFFDVALEIVTDRQELATAEDTPVVEAYGDVLRALARKSDAFNRFEQNLITRIINKMCIALQLKEKSTDPLELLRIIWKNNIMEKLPQKDILNILRGFAIDEEKEIGASVKGKEIAASVKGKEIGATDKRKKQIYPYRTSFLAAEMGNTRFLVELVRDYPDLMFRTDDKNHTMFHIAVMYRNQGVYNLMYEIGSMRDGILKHVDDKGNNMLHLVGLTSKKMRSQTPGASLLMQRELLWFKEVEKVVPPSYREMKNKDGKTPYEIFSKENEDLVSQGLNWMKDCMVVATLIVTVAFAVAFTVPGGYNTDGLPVFIHHRTFLVFVIADAISLFFSATSLLVFLSVLTSRHAQHDFLSSLPTKLMIGLVSLFFSVVALMVTFSASFFVLYRVKWVKWVPIFIAAFSAMPVLTFLVLQFPLCMDMLRSVIDPHYLFKPNKRVLYKTKPKSLTARDRALCSTLRLKITGTLESDRSLC